MTRFTTKLRRTTLGTGLAQQKNSLGKEFYNKAASHDTGYGKEFYDKTLWHDTGYGTLALQRTQQTAPSEAVVIEQVDLCTI